MLDNTASSLQSSNKEGRVLHCKGNDTHLFHIMQPKQNILMLNICFTLLHEKCKQNQYPTGEITRAALEGLKTFMAN